VEVDLPRPRNSATREAPRFFELVNAVRERLRAAGAEMVTPEEAGVGEAELLMVEEDR
jgi:hypothetical protein